MTVELTSAEVEVPLAVAADAVQSLRDWSVVFGRYGLLRFEARPGTGPQRRPLRGGDQGFGCRRALCRQNSFLIKADIGKAGARHDH